MQLLHIAQRVVKQLRPILKRGWRVARGLLRLAVRHRKFTSLLLVVTGLGIFLVVRVTSHPAAAGQAPPDSTFQANTSGALEKGTPKYATLLPKGRSIDQLGGWTRISPPNKNPVYAYTDQINGINISVSQQPLPADFQPDVATQIAELAKNFGATEQFSALDTKIYLGTSAKGPQSIIFTKSNLLILVKSAAPLSTATWQNYLTSLD